ncbi:MAG: B12-binding domain-containing radical SAM protein, partial [Lachnospiraceae bacterium]|nr:B12-binding domain-containing radical SAM protein [Lachnospiraceae bacterium]
MRKPFLSDEILLSVEKPARYTGGEVNMVVKDPAACGIRFCMCFPDVYEVGMSHLGIQILYDMFNRREDTYCERVYSPWVDLDKIMREKKIPLFSLETQTPIKQFDFLGITLQYEMCYTNILQVLDLSGIPLRSKDRGEDDPIVVGGGPCSYNPEPIADFFDFFYIGEGETSYDAVLDLYKENKRQGG